MCMAGLAVIIVYYNCAEWLPACLNSVYARAGSADVEVVVVDNDSTDGSAELVERQFPDVRLLRCENRGFAQNNRGLKAVDAPYVLFLNADTEILTGTFGELLPYSTCAGVGLVGCRQVTPDGVVYPTIRRFPTPRGIFSRRWAPRNFRSGLMAWRAGSWIRALVPTGVQLRLDARLVHACAPGSRHGCGLHGRALLHLL